MEKDEAARLLRIAVETIEGLADQQAATDYWYLSPLAILQDRLNGLEEVK
jgi:hypothetical protein